VRRGRPSTIASHPRLADIRSRLIAWEAHRCASPEARAVHDRPPSLAALAARFGVSRRALSRWWREERQAIFDRLPQDHSAVYHALGLAQQFVRPFRSPKGRPPAAWELVEERLARLAERAAADLDPEDGYLLRGAAVILSSLFLATFVETDRQLKDDRARHEAAMLSLVEEVMER